MIYPLVNNSERAFYVSKVSNRVFCKNSKSKTVNHLWNTMVNFRVQVIRTTGKNNTASTLCDDFFECLFTLLANFFTEFFLLSPGLFYCSLNCLAGKFRELRKHFFTKTFCKCFLVINRKEWIHVSNCRILAKLVYVVAENFRITCYDRTVIVISCSRVFLVLIRCTRIEYKLHAALQK